MEVQPQLVLLQKTLLNIEGLGRQLYPDLDLWKTAKPFLERWMEEQVGAQSLLNALKENIPYLVEKLPEMPGLIYAATKKMAEGEEHEKQLREIEKIRDDMRRNNQRTVMTIAGTGLLMGGLIVFGLDGFTPTMIWGAPLVSWIAGGLGAFILLVSLQD